MSEAGKDEEQEASEIQPAPAAPGEAVTPEGILEDAEPHQPQEAPVDAPTDKTPTGETVTEAATAGGTAVDTPANKTPIEETASEAATGTEVQSRPQATVASAVDESGKDTTAKDTTGESEEPEEPGRKPAAGTREIARSSGGLGQRLRRNWPVAVLAATTLVLIAGITVALRNASDTPEPKTGAQAAPPPDMETYRDNQAGFVLRYPKGWRRLPVPAGSEDLRLVLSVGGQSGEDDGMWVRTVPPERVDQKINEFASEIQQVTGGTPCGAQGSACLLQEQVAVSGMNGVRYAYITKEQPSGQENLHLQYFLRQPQGNLYVLVFQALPKTDLAQLAPAFDQVLSSFQVTKQAGPVTSTTAAR